MIWTTLWRDSDHWSQWECLFCSKDLNDATWSSVQTTTFSATFSVTVILQKITSVSNFTTFSSNYPGWPSVIRNIFRDILRVCWIQLKFCLVDIKTASALTVVNMNSAIGFEGALDCTIHRCTWCSGRHDSHDLIMTLTWKDIWLQRNE